MDGRNRSISKRSLALALGVAAAGQLTWIAPCRGQSSPSSYPSTPSRASQGARRDPDLVRSGLHHVHASSQEIQTPQVPSKPAPPVAPPTAPPSAPPAVPPAAPPGYPSYPAYPAVPPVYAPGYSAPPAPGYGMQYVMVPVMPQYPVAPPMGPPAAPPAAPGGNFFLPGAAPPVAPPAVPAYAMPAMPPAYAMPAMAPPAMPAAAVGTGAALTGSSVSVPTSASSSSVEIRGPGLISAGLARVGARLVQLGRTRVRTVQETVLQTPQSQPVGGSATIATTGTVPILPPAAPPSAPPAAPPAAPPETPPTPTPQGEHGHHGHSLLNHLFGHD